MNATTLLVVWMGGKQVLVGDMPVGNLTAFTTYIVQVLMSLMMLAMVLLQSSREMCIRDSLEGLDGQAQIHLIRSDVFPYVRQVGSLDGIQEHQEA